MANTIRLKRGSGSDPSANDLVVGELAIRTDSGKIFTKKDNGTVAEISGGGGIDDGDKGDITISNGGDTFTIDSGVIDNANIASNAAIDGTKISPNFGSQNITSTGTFKVSKSSSQFMEFDTGANLILNAPTPRIQLNDVNSENDYQVMNADGTFVIRDLDRSVNFYSVSAAGVQTFTGNCDFSNGIDVTGAITSTGHLTITNANPAINLVDNNNNPDYQICNINGALRFRDTTNTTDRILINTDGHVDIAGNLDVGSGIDVTGASTFSGGITSTGSLILNQGTPEIQLNATSHENDFRIINYQGNFIIQDVDALANRIAIQSDGTTTIQRNLNCSAGVDVTGNITVTGTVDGVDIAARNTLFGGLTSSSGVLSNGVTATTQAQSDNSTKVSTTAYVRTAISNLVNSAPSTLDTLKELSDALGADANFSTTVTNSIATKLPLAGGTLTGNLTIENTEPQIFLKDSNNNDDFTIRNTNGVFTIRDATNGVDRLTINSSGTAKILGKTEIGNDLTRPSALDSDADGACRIGGGDVHLYVASLGQGGGYKVAMQAARSSDFASFTLNLQSNGGALQRGGNTVWDAGTDGAGSGLDADLLDGVQGSSYLRSDANDTLTGDLTLNGRLVANHGAAPATGANYFFSDDGSTTTIGTAATLRVANNGGNAAYSVFEAESGSGSIRLANDGKFYVTGSSKFSSFVRTDISSTVDGYMGEAYSGYFGLKHTDQTLNSEYMILSQDTHTFISASSGSNVYIRGGGNATVNQMIVSASGTTIGGNSVLTSASSLNASNIGSGTIPSARLSASDLLTLIKTVDGSGSGLNAEVFNGKNDTEFLRSNVADTATEDITFSGGAGAVTIAANSDIRFANGSNWTGDVTGKIQLFNNTFYISGGTGGIIFREGGTSRWIIDGDGHFIPINGDGLLDIGTNTVRVRNGYFDTLYGSGANLTNLPSQTDQNFTTALKNKLDGIAAGATNVTNTNQLTNGAGFLTSVGTSNISNDAVTFAKIENIATGGIIGRNNSGTGSVERLTASEVRAIINVENGATADQSASEILTLIKTVDGAGSGLDADTLDGISSTSFLRSDADDTTSGQLRITYSNIYPLNIDSANNGKIVLQGSNDPYIRFRESATDKAYIQWNSNGFLEINNQETNEGLRIKTGNNGLVFTENGAEYRVFHAGNMGSGSGLDADNLDSLGSHQFVRSDADDTITGSITFSKDAVDVINFSANSTNLNRGIAFNSRTALSAQYNDGWLRINNNSEFTNGVFTPLKIRADQGFHVGGTTIINGNAQVIASRLTGALPAIDGSALTGISAGATGGGSDEVFYENGQTVTTDYTITNGKNAMAAGPITINSGVTVTVGSGENLTIV